MAEKDANLFDKINGVPYYILPDLPQGTIRLQNMGQMTVYIETDSEETLRACVQLGNILGGDKTVETCRNTFNNTLVNFRGEPFVPDFIVDSPTVKLGPRAPDAVETTRRKSCNRHADCDAANAAVKAKGGLAAAHCWDECCEDCFGC